MRNVAIVGLDSIFVMNLSRQLASSLGFEYIDIDTTFERELLVSNNEPLFFMNEIWGKREGENIFDVAQKYDVVISIRDDSFLSNEHYELFADSLTILIEREETDKIRNNIQNLIKKHCKMSFSQENFDFNKFLSIIRGVYDGQ